jgi:hypothetical protein
MELDLFQLSKLVRDNGGLQIVINKGKWSKIADELKIPKSVASRDERLQAFYYRCVPTDYHCVVPGFVSTCLLFCVA